MTDISEENDHYDNVTKTSHKEETPFQKGKSKRNTYATVNNIIESLKQNNATDYYSSERHENDFLFVLCL